MSSKGTSAIEAVPESEYQEKIQEYLADIASIRREMKKTDAEILQLKTSTSKKLDNTWAIIREIEESL